MADPQVGERRTFDGQLGEWDGKAWRAVSSDASVPRPGAFGRFVEGAVQPIAQLPEMLGSLVTDPKGVGRGIIEPSMRRLDMAAQANREGRPAAALGNAAAAIPIIGPAVAGGIDQMTGGDVAGGAGTLTGLAAPFMAGPLTRGGISALRGTSVGTDLADALDASANRRMVDTIAPKVGPNKLRFGTNAKEVAPRLLRDPNLSAFSRSGLADKISARLDQATEGLDAAADNRSPSAQVQTGPLLKQINAAIGDLTAQPVEASTFPRGARTPPSVTPAEQVGGITGELTDAQSFKTEPLGRPVEPAPNDPQLRVLKQMRDEVSALGPVAPYEAIRRIRQAWDQVAKVKYSPAVSPDFLAKQGEATGAAKGTGALRESLAGVDSDTAKANDTYHLYRTANDVIQAAEQADRVRPNRGRGIMARTTGAMIGAQTGGAVGAGIGAIVAEMADRASSMAPSFQILIARKMAGIADALRSGDAVQAQAILDRTVSQFPAVKSGLKITGKLLPAMASDAASLPLAAGGDSKNP